VKLADLQVREAPDERAVDEAAGEVLSLAHHQPGDGGAGHQEEQTGRGHDETGGRGGLHPASQPAVERVEHHVEHGCPQQPRDVGPEGDRQADPEQADQDLGALVP